MKKPTTIHATLDVTEQSLYERIRTLLVSARQSVARGVDLIQVQTNFEIGRYIVEFEQQGSDRAAYGKAVIKDLANRLTVEFGSGFSDTNLKLMKGFFNHYRDRIGQISQPLTDLLTESQIDQSTAGQLSPSSAYIRPFCVSWTHYVFLLTIKNPAERSFYEIESANESWTLRELKRQYDTSLYERLALSRDKDGIRKLSHEGQIVASVQDIFKEPLVLEFLGLAEQAQYSESDLESAIIGQIEWAKALAQ